MKAVSFICIFASFNLANAADTACLIKQKNADSYEFAQSAAVPVQEIQVIKVKMGVWTNDPSDNVGTDEITVLGNRPHGPTEATYLVTAKQIGSFNTCTILKVEQ